MELQIKYKHSNENLECINKLSALIAVQHLYVALLSVLTTRYCIPYEYLILLCNITFVAQEFPLNLPRKVLHTVHIKRFAGGHNWNDKGVSNILIQSKGLMSGEHRVIRCQGGYQNAQLSQDAK